MANTGAFDTRALIQVSSNKKTPRNELSFVWGLGLIKRSMRLFLYSSRFLRRGCRAPGFGTPSLRLGLGLGLFLVIRVPYDSILSWFLIFLWCCVGFGLGCRSLEEQALERELRVCSEFCYGISSF